MCRRPWQERAKLFLFPTLWVCHGELYTRLYSAHQTRKEQTLSSCKTRALCQGQGNCLFNSSLHSSTRLLPLLFLTSFHPIMYVSLSHEINRRHCSKDCRFVLPTNCHPFCGELPTQCNDYLCPRKWPSPFSGRRDASFYQGPWERAKGREWTGHPPSPTRRACFLFNPLSEVRNSYYRLP